MTELTHADLEKLKEIIEDKLEDWSIENHPQETRTHLGISEIGQTCYRKVFYKFRWMAFENHDGRMRRLFARGHREEERYISYLEALGWKVFRTDENGNRFKVSGVLGHYGGECDTILKAPDNYDIKYQNIPFLGEFKTHNTKSFVHYVDKGLQISKPQHWDQMCGYGWKLNIQYGIYFPENKNDDDIKLTCVKLDWNRGQQLERKAEEIIFTQEPLERISENPAYWECKLCFAFDICHNGKIPEKNCRSCKNSKPVENAEWLCKLHGIIPKSFIKQGCDKWIPI